MTAKGNTTPAATPTAADDAGKAPTVLEDLGRRAIARLGCDEVRVTTDGQIFLLECDATNHAANLADKKIITVKKAPTDEHPDNSPTER